ncbi:MAG: hypothetical protein ACOYI5_08455 [Christensenellales bacterium]|jgi:hypothetical protein
MQPVAVISCRVPGILYINGRFAGECAPDAPLITPVSPRGAVYIEHRPLARGYAGQAHRVAFSSGALVSESVPDGVTAVRWPGGIAELELSDAPLARAESAFANVDGLPVALLRAEGTSLRVAGGELSLPEDAGLPEARAVLGEAVCLLGAAGAGRYLACYDAATFAPIGAIVADDIEIEDSGGVRALTKLGDTVGHARIEMWALLAGALEPVDSEYAWANGTPDWPKTAEDTALAAFEAAILGLDAEAEGYLAPPLRASARMARLAEGYSAATRLKYALPDHRQAIGLVRAETDRCAAVVPVYYKASAMGGAQGAWAIDALERGT